MEPLIQIDHLTKTYGKEVHAVDDVSLTIEPGEYIALMGPSGSGKSTLLHLLGLLDRPSRGTYHMAGRDVLSLTESELAALRGQRIGFIFQSFHLIPRVEAQENVALPLQYAGVKEALTVARESLARVDLLNRVHYFPNQLSGGQQQRVAIARALAIHPWILMADEPTGNLASEQAHEILSIIDGFAAKGVTVIVVTHDADVASHAQRMIRMRDGKIISDERKRNHAPSTPLSTSSLFQKGKALGIWNQSRIAVRALARNKLRTILATLGVIVGVGAVLTMTALGGGARKSVQERISSLGSNLLILSPYGPKARGIAKSASDFTKLTLADSDDLSKMSERGVPIATVNPTLSGSVQITYKGKNWDTRLQGVGPGYVQARAAKPQWGRFFTQVEYDNRARVCLVGATVIRSLFEPGVDPVGEEIRINRNAFLIIGVLPEKGQSTWSDQDDVVVTPATTAMHRALGRDAIDFIDVVAKNDTDRGAVVQAIRDWMRKRNRLRADQPDNFDIRDMAEMHAVMEDTTNTITLLLGAIAAVSLLVGGIGIMNIMLVAVKERTREIGLRKALGARGQDVLSQFLVESAVISIVGGCIGTLIGAAASLLIAKLWGWMIDLSPVTILSALFCSVAIGVLAGLWPARQAALMNPIEALRYE